MFVSVSSAHSVFWFLSSLPFTVPFNPVHSRVPGSTTSTSSPLPLAPAPASAPNPEPSPHSWVAAAGDGGRLSSDEGDAETPEDADRPAFHCSNRHPQPLGVNTITTTLTARTDVFIVCNILLFLPWRAYFNMPFRGVICSDLSVALIDFFQWEKEVQF